MEKRYHKNQEYIRAEKRVQRIKGFYTHLAAAPFIIGINIFINLQFSPQFHWFWFVVIIIPLTVIIHWIGVFGFEKFGLGKNWEDKKIEQMMKEDNF